MFRIAPSILAADFLHLERDLESVNRSGDILHLDVMDGSAILEGTHFACLVGTVMTVICLIVSMRVRDPKG